MTSRQRKKSKKRKKDAKKNKKQALTNGMSKEVISDRSSENLLLPTTPDKKVDGETKSPLADLEMLDVVVDVGLIFYHKFVGSKNCHQERIYNWFTLYLFTLVSCKVVCSLNIDLFALKLHTLETPRKCFALFLCFIFTPYMIWTTSWQNQQNDMCAQRRLRSAWASSQSDQSLRYALSG